MRIIFMGSPDFAVAPLQALVQAGHQVLAVYTQPPRPKGRGQGVEKTAVHVAAEALGLPVYCPPSLKPPEAEAEFVALAQNADVAVVAAYGLILRQNVLQAPRLGCINIHASLLPRWRGAAPIHRAILAGDNKTGITIMQMDVGLDTGPMLLVGETPIAAHDTTLSVHDRLRDLGADLIVQALAKLQAGDLPPIVQPEAGVTYAHKIDKNERWVNWQQPAEAIVRQLRAFTPWPGVWCHAANGVALRLGEVQAQPSSHPQATPGTVLAVQPLCVQCGEGSMLCIEQIQREGAKMFHVKQFLNGFHIEVGEQWHGALAVNN